MNFRIIVINNAQRVVLELKENLSVSSVKWIIVKCAISKINVANVKLDMRNFLIKKLRNIIVLCSARKGNINL